MDCKETQRCIPMFLKDELDWSTAQKFVEHVYSCSDCMEELSIEYLLFEGMSRIENADEFDMQKELEKRLNRTIADVRRKKQLKAGLFLLISLLLCIILLGGA
ncbi:MAG: zf-HC2 domain-containing protein [Lachnospiraceae bacterium]|nr:zf-HC2 domain-containing protein [Lachnospiraceae bacterium]